MSAQKEVPQIFDEMLTKAKPKARYMAELYNQQLTDMIYNQLFNGENQITSEKQNVNEIIQKYTYENQMRKKFLTQAEKEKLELQHKLQYLQLSIKSMKNHGQKQGGSPRNIKGMYSKAQSLQRQKELKKKLKEWEEIIQKKKKEAEEMKKKRQVQMAEIEKRIKKQNAEKKKKYILENMKKIQEGMKDRQKFVQSGKQRYKKVKNEKSMFQKIYSSFQQKQNNLLEERKRKLSQIRNFHKPIDASDIGTHQKKFLQLKKQKEELRERQLRMNSERSKSSRPMFYHSAFYKKARDEERNEEQNYSSVRADKVKRFAEHVKQNFTPQIDEKKREEIEKKLQEQKKRDQQRKERGQDIVDKSRVKGKQYLTFLRKMEKPKKPKSPIQRSPPKTDRIIYKNYITHSQKEQDDEQGWKKILNKTGNKKDKAMMLHFASQKVEQELKRKQQQIKLNKKDLQNEVDDEYFSMIRAKLDLLQE